MADVQEELFDEPVQAEDEVPSVDQIAEIVESFDKHKEEPKPDEHAETEAEAPEASADEPSKKGESSVIQALRKQNREKDRDLREYKRKIQELTAVKEPELGEKPTLERYDYNQEKFERALEDWTVKKISVDAKLAAKKSEEDQIVKKYQDRLASYATEKSALSLPDYNEAEAIVKDLLDQAQQSIIIQGAKNRALLIYALGKNEETTKKLAAIKDPVEYAFEVARLEARLEGQMKEAKKRPATAPESRVTGGASGTVDSTLERLRKEAEKTGDMSKVLAYKRSKKQS